MWEDNRPSLAVHNLAEVLGGQAATRVPGTKNLAVRLEELDPVYHGLAHVDEDVELEWVWGPNVNGDEGVAGDEGTWGRLDKALLKDLVPGCVVCPMHHTLHLVRGLQCHYSVLLGDAEHTHHHTLVYSEDTLQIPNTFTLLVTLLILLHLSFLMTILHHNYKEINYRINELLIVVYNKDIYCDIPQPLATNNSTEQSNLAPSTKATQLNQT